MSIERKAFQGPDGKTYNLIRRDPRWEDGDWHVCAAEEPFPEIPGLPSLPASIPYMLVAPLLLAAWSNGYKEGLAAGAEIGEAERLRSIHDALGIRGTGAVLPPALQPKQ